MLGRMHQRPDLLQQNPGGPGPHAADTTPGRDAWFDRHTQNLDPAGVVRGGVFDGMTHPEALAQRDSLWSQVSHGMQNIWNATAQGATSPASLAALSARIPTPQATLPAKTPCQSSGTDCVPSGHGSAMGAAPAQQPSPASAPSPDPAATRQAIIDQHTSQVMNPGATVDAARLVREAGLAADGVRDLGGGNRMINNPHATGVAVTGATPTPGPHVFDNGRPVDLAASKQAGTITYGTGEGLAAGQLRSAINNQVAALVPGADERLKKDRDQEVQHYTDATAIDRFNIQHADGDGSAEGDC